MALRIKYNAPVSLSFALLCTAVLICDQYLGTNLTYNYFIIDSKQSFDWANYPSYYHLLSHIVGHYNWQHLISNLTYLLLLGPILEERYGSFKLCIMIAFTALVTGLINALFSNSKLIGASGLVFMFITLISMVNIQKKEIPLTLLLVLALYLVQEFLALFSNDGVSQLTHIIGGLAGMILGFIIKPARRWRPAASPAQGKAASGSKKGQPQEN